jgi:hypothetical protein
MSQPRSISQLAAVQFVWTFFVLFGRFFSFTFKHFLCTLIFATMHSFLERSTASVFLEVWLHASFQAGSPEDVVSAEAERLNAIYACEQAYLARHCFQKPRPSV